MTETGRHGNTNLNVTNNAKCHSEHDIYYIVISGLKCPAIAEQDRVSHARLRPTWNDELHVEF